MIGSVASLAMTRARAGELGSSAALRGALLAIPLAGFWLLLAAPTLDGHWEQHPAHFWLVLGAAAVNASLALATGDAARQRGDARLFLVSLAFLAAAGCRGRPPLPPPGVLPGGRTAGFVIPTPVGLVVAGGFPALSREPLEGE